MQDKSEMYTGYSNYYENGKPEREWLNDAATSDFILWHFQLLKMSVIA